MANQWGREQGSARSNPRSTITPLVVAVLLVAAAGGYVWYAGQQAGDRETGLRQEIIELTDRLAATEQEKDRLADRLSGIDTGADARLESLERELSILNETEIPRLTALLALRDGEVSRLRSELDAARAAQGSGTEANEAQLADLRGLLAAEREQVSLLTQKIAQLQTETTVLRRELGDARRERLAVARDNDALQARLESDLARARESARRLTEERDALLRDRLPALEAERDQALRALQAARQAAVPPQDAASPTDDSSDPAPTEGQTLPSDATPSSTPRERLRVERIVSQAPGTVTLDAAKRQRLIDDLVAGRCVTVSLGAAFERIPVVTLRNLIRDFGGDC